MDAEPRGTTADAETACPPDDGASRELRSRDALSESVDAVTQPIGRSAAVGTLWLTAQKWVVRLSGFLTIAILARLISPTEFGVVAAAAAIIPVVLLLADLGLSAYIVQAEELRSRTVSTGFWFSLTAGVLLAGAMALAAPALAGAFNVQGSSDVLRGMSVAALATVLASMPTALLRRRLRFKLLALQAGVATLIAQVIAIALALLGAGAWALVAQLAISQALIGLLAWKSSHWRPAREFSVAEFRTMARFGAKVMAVEGVAAARVAGEAAIISNALGPAALGYVSIAQRLVQTAQDLGASAFAPVSIAVFAKVRQDPERLRAGYQRAVRMGYTAVTPVLVLVAVGAPYIVPFVFGSDWEPSIPVAQALAVAAILVLGAMIDHGLHYGLGAPGRWLIYAVAIDVLTVATTFVLAPYGLTYVAVGFVGVALAATVVRWVLVAKLIGLPARVLALDFAKDMVPVGLSALVGLSLMAVCSDCPRIGAVLLVGASIGITHVLAVRVFNRQVLTDILEVLPIADRLKIMKRLA